MRVVISENSKRKLLEIVKRDNNCRTLGELSNRLKINKKTLESWFYLKISALPYELFAKYLSKGEIIEIKQDNWGQLRGGKLSYNKTLKEKGVSEVRRKQSLGGKMAAKTKEREELRKFKLDLQNPLFLEFYGILLGDGWLSNFKSSEKEVWLVGISSNLTLDKEFVRYYSNIIKELFNRNGNLRRRPDNNSSEFIFGHKILLKYLNEKLRFPIGKKNNLNIPEFIRSLGFDKTKNIIRGLFDTDGSFYLEKNKKGVPSYPIISFHMNELILIKQIGEMLKEQGFNVNYSDGGKMIKIKGREQLKRWLDKIGSSNPYKLNKMKQNMLL